MSAFRKDILFALAIIAFLVLFWQQTYEMSATAANYPRILMGLIFTLTLVMLVQSFLQRHIQEEAPAPTLFVRIGLFVALLVAYVLSMNTVGYFFATPIFVVISCALLRAVSLKVSICIGVGFSVFIYILFVKFLHLPVPLGLLEYFLGG